MQDEACVLLEGEVKHRNLKKWRARWAVLTKLSPVAGELCHTRLS